MRHVLASLPSAGRQRLEAMQQAAAAAAKSGNVAMVLEVTELCLTEAAQALEQAQTERAAARYELAEARAMQNRLEDGLRIRGILSDLGHDLRPDPRGSQTPAELMEALRSFRKWAGNPSFRRMWRHGGGRVGVSTMCTVLSRNALPERFDVIDAIVEGCGGTEDDRRRFATAWRELTLARSPARIVRPLKEAGKAALAR